MLPFQSPSLKRYMTGEYILPKPFTLSLLHLCFEMGLSYFLGENLNQFLPLMGVSPKTEPQYHASESSDSITTTCASPYF